MQSFTHEDLLRMFPRVSEVVNFQGAKNAKEVNDRIERAIKEFPPKLSPGWIGFLRKLTPWFGFATIDAARADPHGEIALTLEHGRRAARMIIEEQSRKYLEYQRKKAEQRKYRRKK